MHWIFLVILDSRNSASAGFKTVVTWNKAGKEIFLGNSIEQRWADPYFLVCWSAGPLPSGLPI
jgi:hypothetical protein